MINRTTLLLAQSIPLIEWLAPALMAAGLFLLLVIAVLLARRPKVISTRHPDDQQTGLQQLIDARQELQDERQRVAELIGVAQRLASKSDDKAALLNQLITQADERLASLDGLPSSGAIESSSQAGHDPAGIAHELDETQGQVELVISRKMTGPRSQL